MLEEDVARVHIVVLQHFELLLQAYDLVDVGAHSCWLAYDLVIGGGAQRAHPTLCLVLIHTNKRRNKEIK